MHPYHSRTVAVHKYRSVIISFRSATYPPFTHHTARTVQSSLALAFASSVTTPALQMVKAHEQFPLPDWQQNGGLLVAARFPLCPAGKLSSPKISIPLIYVLPSQLHYGRTGCPNVFGIIESFIVMKVGWSGCSQLVCCTMAIPG